MARLLGETLATDEIESLLAQRRVRSPIASATTFRVAAPTWRGDVTAEADLIEEVARLRGYDSFPIEIRPFRPSNVGDDPQWISSRAVREALVGAGLLEARPMPFVVGGEGFVRVIEPAVRGRGVSAARHSRHARRVAPSTILARMQGNVRLFEIGSVFEPDANRAAARGAAGRRARHGPATAAAFHRSEVA